MRLTLRTMLAYLDEILDPEDQAAIGKKIEESEFASDLVHRIRDTTRKLRLDAPALSGRTMGLDPNTVAEYLDNALPAERVPEFERACLESDVCLAEVAACHQILTLVLGHPAEVDMETRRRMYMLGPRADSETTAVEPPAETGPAGAAEGPAGASKGSRARPKIPDYLRESSASHGWRYVAAVLIVAAVLGGLTLLAVGPGNLLNGFADHVGPVAQTPPEAAVSSDQTPTGPPRGEQIEPDAGGSVAGANSTGRTDSTPPASTPGAAEQPQATGPAAQPPSEGPETSAPAASGPPAPTETTTTENAPPTAIANDKGRHPEPPLPSRTPTDASSAGPVEGTQSQPKAGGAGPGAAPSAKVRPPAPPGEKATRLGETGAVGEKTGQGEPGTPTTGGTSPQTAATDARRSAAGPAPKVADQRGSGPATSAAEPAKAKRAATADLAIFSNAEILLKFDRQSRQWRRLPLRAPVAAGEKLLALPSFRPQVTLTSGSGITLEMVGPAAVVLRAADAQGVPGIDLIYGRLILLNVGGADNRLRIQLGNQRPQVTFGGVGTTLALDLVREHIPGTDPEKVPARVLVHGYGTSGKLDWKMADGQPAVTMQAPSEWVLDGDQVRQVADADGAPAWIDSASLSGIDLRAARSLDEELAVNRPVGLVLQELVEGQHSGRRSEVRSLAARCSVHVGQFESFVDALNDPEQKTWRPRLIESLEEALALGPDVAAKIRQAFERQRGKEAGDALYRLLWGYSAADLKAGADRQLVDYLQNDQLDFRLLALWNLTRITGLGQPNRLQDPKASRQYGVRVWKKRFEEKQIVPKASKAKAGAH